MESGARFETPKQMAVGHALHAIYKCDIIVNVVFQYINEGAMAHIGSQMGEDTCI